MKIDTIPSLLWTNLTTTKHHTLDPLQKRISVILGRFFSLISSFLHLSSQNNNLLSSNITLIKEPSPSLEEGCIEKEEEIDVSEQPPENSVEEKKDFTKFLPEELSSLIFSYLPIKNLALPSKCSQNWNRLAQDNVLYGRFLREMGGEDLDKKLENLNALAKTDSVGKELCNQSLYEYALLLRLKSIQDKNIKLKKTPRENVIESFLDLKETHKTLKGFLDKNVISYLLTKKKSTLSDKENSFLSSWFEQVDQQDVSESIEKIVPQIKMFLEAAHTEDFYPENTNVTTTTGVNFLGKIIKSGSCTFPIRRSDILIRINQLIDEAGFVELFETPFSSHHPIFSGKKLPNTTQKALLNMDLDLVTRLQKSSTYVAPDTQLSSPRGFYTLPTLDFILKLAKDKRYDVILWMRENSLLLAASSPYTTKALIRELVYANEIDRLVWADKHDLVPTQKGFLGSGIVSQRIIFLMTLSYPTLQWCHEKEILPAWMEEVWEVIPQIYAPTGMDIKLLLELIEAFAIDDRGVKRVTEILLLICQQTPNDHENFKKFESILSQYSSPKQGANYSPSLSNRDEKEEKILQELRNKINNLPRSTHFLSSPYHIALRILETYIL